MDTVKINTVIGFHQALIDLKDISTRTIFRGVSNCDYQLIPSLGRIGISEKIYVAEKILMGKFKESAIAYIDRVPNNEFEWLALAQHHGLPTRLLDWTYNPLVALFFAVEKDSENDGRIYVTWKISQVRNKNQDPYHLKKIYCYRPSFVTQRIINQSSVFTVHSCPEKPYEADNMIIFDIDVRIKYELKQMLFKYGVNYKTIYPGLDGLSKDLKWLETHKYISK
jgi:type I restriction enzyme M protein